MKRVLIISYFFAPQNRIGAVRPTKLAKYLSRMGCEVTVICGEGLEPWLEDKTLRRDMEAISDVRIVREWNPLRKIKERKRGNAPEAAGAARVRPSSAGQSSSASVPSGLRALIAKAANAAYLMLGVFSDISFRKKAMRELDKLSGKYDAVFSSYSPMSVHAVAREAKRRGIATKWIADFRDEPGVPFRFMNRRLRRELRQTQTDCDLVTVVSDGLLNIMKVQGRVLNNGFDREDSPEPESAEAGRFRAIYCGQLNMGRAGVADRALTPCFKAFAELIERGELKQSELELAYAGSQGGVFEEQAAAAGLLDCVKDIGTVPRERSLALQRGSELLLLATRNEAGLTGMLTGKMFEYMMAGKPILCCVGGNLPGSETRRVLEETGSGFCFEEACAEDDMPGMVKWLSGVVSGWRQGGKCGDSAALRANRYDYEALARTLAEWMGSEAEQC